MGLNSCNKFKKRGGGFCLRASKEKSIKNVSRQFHFSKMFIILVFIFLLDTTICVFNLFLFVGRREGVGGKGV